MPAFPTGPVQMRCLNCDMEFFASKDIDPEEFSGDIKCPHCGAYFEVRVKYGKVQSKRLIRVPPGQDKSQGPVLPYSRPRQTPVIEQKAEKRT